jgi:hypothetical protein
MNSGRAVRQTRRKDGHAHPLQPTFYHFGELYVQTSAVVNVFLLAEQRLTRKKQQLQIA